MKFPFLARDPEGSRAVPRTGRGAAPLPRTRFHFWCRAPKGPALPSRRSWGRSTSATKGSTLARDPEGSRAFPHAGRGAAPLPSREGFHSGAGPRRALRYFTPTVGPLHCLAREVFTFCAGPQRGPALPSTAVVGPLHFRHAVGLLPCWRCCLEGAAAGTHCSLPCLVSGSPAGERGFETTCEGPERALRIPSRRQWGRSTTDDATVPIRGASNRPIHRQSDRRLELHPTRSAVAQVPTLGAIPADPVSMEHSDR